MSTHVTPYQPSSFSELEVFCQRITRSGMVPKQYQGKPDDAFVAIVYGAEVGLPPLAALQHIAVINGRPGLYGDAIAGVALKSGAITNIHETMEGERGTDNWTARCVVTRPDGSKVDRTFSVADAKKAGLWNKQGPWSSFPQRMLAARARGYAVRDSAQHAFMGYTVEELRDIDDAEPARGPDHARDITPPDTTTPAASPQAAVAAANAAAEAARKANEMKQLVKVVDQHGETVMTTSHWPEALKKYRELTVNSTDPQQVGINNLGMLKAVRPHVSEKVRPKLEAEIEAIETIMAAPAVDEDGVVEESTYSDEPGLFEAEAPVARENAA